MQNHFVPVIAQGLQLRYKKRGKNPLEIILAENLRKECSGLFKKGIKKSSSQGISV